MSAAAAAKRKAAIQAAKFPNTPENPDVSGNVMSVFKPMMHGLAYLGFVLGGLALGALVGYMGGAGLASLLGMAIGLTVGGLLAMMVTGDCGKCLDFFEDKGLDITEPLVPGFARELAYGHDSFSLLVTIHELRSAAQDDTLVGGKAATFDAYVVLTCGDNPPKSTCVRTSGVFHETFKVHIQPRDQHLRFEIRDQDVMIDDDMGQTDVHVNSIIEEGFPVRKSYDVMHGAKKAGRLVLSFDWTDDFPMDRLQDVMQRRPTEFARRNVIRQECMTAYQTSAGGSAPYGTFATQWHFGDSLFKPGRGP